MLNNTIPYFKPIPSIHKEWENLSAVKWFTYKGSPPKWCEQYTLTTVQTKAARNPSDISEHTAVLNIPRTTDEHW